MLFSVDLVFATAQEVTEQQASTLDITLNEGEQVTIAAVNGEAKASAKAASSAAVSDASITVAVSDTETGIVAPNVDLKEVAPVPEVLPKTTEATAESNATAEKNVSVETPAVTIPDAPAKTPLNDQKTKSASSNATVETGENSKAVERKPKYTTDKATANTASTGTTSNSAETAKKSGPESTTTDAPVQATAESNKAATATKKKPTIKATEPAAESPAKSSIKAVIESLKTQTEPSVQEKAPFLLLGAKVPPNTSTRLAWQPDVAITGLALPVPVLVINGKQPGETLCLTAAIHGDELNGIEVVRRVMYDIAPEKLSGQVIGIPIVNLQGFQRASRYLVDRRDLNRYFPGEKKGSLASRVAYSLFNEVIRHCSILVDLHTGSLRRTNLPQLRADMSDLKVAKFTEYFDQMVVVHSAGESGMLRTAAQKIGIPAVTLEIGESLRLQEDQVDSGVRSINSLMDRRQMYSRFFTWGDPEPIYYKSFWIRAEQGGILFSNTKLGDQVEKGQVLGIVTDPITNAESKIKAPYAGRVIGMAVNQVVMPGFAAYHLGAEATERDISEAATQAVKQEASLDDELEDINPEEADPLESDPLE